MSEDEPLRLGLVGCGGIAQIVHLPILTTMDGVDVAAVCDINRSKAESVAERFGVPSVYDSVEEFLDDGALDGTVVCTPTHLHQEHVTAALRAGCHVLCERPLARDAREVADLLAVAETTDRTLLVAHNHRYRPDALALRRCVHDDQLGRIFHVAGIWQRRRTRRPRRSDWRRKRREAGGGVLMDLGVTLLDLGLWLLGYPEPQRVDAHLRRASDQTVDHSAVVLLQLAGDVTLNVQVSWDLVAPDDTQTLQALGERGSGTLSPFAVYRQGDDGGIENITPRLAPRTENVYTASYRSELDHFLAIARGETEEALPREQEVLMSVVDACYRSAHEESEIVL